MDELPATPMPTTVRGRARARVAELRIMHGWNSQSPITISKPKSGGTERAREAMNKRMRNLGFFEVARSRRARIQHGEGARRKAGLSGIHGK